MKQLFMDTECYQNYFLVSFRSKSGAVRSFELYEDHPLDVDGIKRILTHPDAEIVTFNGNNYDRCTLSLALTGKPPALIKKASDDIIVHDLKPWDFVHKYKCELIVFNHIDLIEVAPGMCSLKLYGGRLHAPRLQDLPIAPDTWITPEHRAILRPYCENDLSLTELLYGGLHEQIDLRRTMSAELGVDVRSKSDAQIAESVLKKRYFDKHGHSPMREEIDYTSFLYTPPDYVGFRDEQLCDVLSRLRETELHIRSSGHVEMPEWISDLKITLGNSTYKLGLGGLHSQETEVSHYASDDVLLKDIDVASYYPSMMLNMGMYPEALGPTFLKAYGDIRTERLLAKRSGDKVKADVLKITLNGTFGKTSNRYSILYNPKMMISTTLTGQLSILMLIEALEAYGIPVVSANTDGIVVKCPVKKAAKLSQIVKKWERLTNLETEETDYRSIHSRDVNSYIAIKTDGKVKTKGAFAIGGLAKNPQNEICTEAVINLLAHDIPIMRTIRECNDIRKFLTLRTVNGGAVKGDEYLGKAIRWYYATGEVGTINYKTNGNTVARSEGAKPVMELPAEFPTDVNYDWYINEVNELLMDIGYLERPPKVKLPRKNSKAWKEMFGA